MATTGTQAGPAQIAAGTLPKRPNILWITGEGVPQAALSCYGSRLIDTPNIDRIAREGLCFTNSFVTNGLCAPSRATLLTGTYNNINAMYGNPDVPAANAGSMVPRFDPSQESFPKILKRDGYQTAMLGKWHLPINPAQAGFDYFVYKNGAGGPYYQETGYLGNPAIGSDRVEPQV
ncbi:MAG: sulfatase-like hydrolase/transferase, partial [Terracidiphilus sp.]